MRWDDLFDDLEAHADSVRRAERDLEIADRTRAEIGRLELVNRLRTCIGEQVALMLVGSGSLNGTLLRVGADWLLVSDTREREVVVPLDAVSAGFDLPWSSTSPAAVGPVASRLTLTAALRAIAVDRARVVVVLRDGTTVDGTPDRVAADFVDLAVTGDQAPRASAVARRTTVPYRAISKVVRESQSWI